MDLELRAIPGVANVGGHVGRAVMSDRVANTDSANLWIDLSPKADYEKTLRAIRTVLRGYPGIDSDVVTYPQEKFKDLKTGTDDPVVVRVFGADLAVLRPKANEVRDALRGVKGLTGLSAEQPALAPTVQVDVDLEKAKTAGVKPGDVRRAATTLLSGLLVGNTFENQKVFEVVVLGTPATRQSLNSARDLLIDTPDGGHVRLGDVASVAIKPAPAAIQRDSVSRYVDVTAGIRGRSRGAVLSEVRQRLEKVKFPLEYHYELVGNYDAKQAMRHRVTLAAIGALIAIFLVLQAALGSGRLAIIAFLSLPLALAGSVLAVRIDGGDIEFGALVGFLAVFAIAARAAVLLIRHFQQLEARELDVFGPDLVVNGSRDRFVPMLFTTVTTALFFAPFLLRGDLAGHEILNPMAGVVIGGLVTTTIVTFFIVPAMYLRFGSGQSDAGELDLREIWDIETLDDILHVGNGEKATNGHAQDEVVIDLAAPEARTE
jgi:Cu/Ag efflux pump CusA